MKKTIFALTTIAGLAFSTIASAKDFDNTTASVTAQWDRITVEVEGTEKTGYESATVGVEVLNYSIGNATSNTVDVYFTHYNTADEYAIGAEYGVTYTVNAASLYGSAEVEYNFDTEVVSFTPTVGVAYVVADAVTVWSDVGYTFDASNDFSRVGGVAEIGLDFAVASNIMLTPSVVYAFDQANGASDEAQINLAVGLRF
jgi:hypothetical protein